MKNVKIMYAGPSGVGKTTLAEFTPKLYHYGVCEAQP